MMHYNRVCQFAIPLAFLENPNVIAAAMFGMVVLRASPGSRQRGEPPSFVHYHAWHPKFPSTAFNILDIKTGKTPEPPWVELVIGALDAGTGKVTISWRRHKAPKDEYLWSSTITLDSETMMRMPGFTGEVAGHG